MNLGTGWRVTVKNRWKVKKIKDSTKMEMGASGKVQAPKAMEVVAETVSCCPEACHEVMEDVEAALM